MLGGGIGIRVRAASAYAEGTGVLCHRARQAGRRSDALLPCRAGGRRSIPCVPADSEIGAPGRCARVSGRSVFGGQRLPAGCRRSGSRVAKGIYPTESDWIRVFIFQSQFKAMNLIRNGKICPVGGDMTNDATRPEVQVAGEVAAAGPLLPTQVRAGLAAAHWLGRRALRCPVSPPCRRPALRQGVQGQNEAKTKPFGWCQGTGDGRTRNEKMALFTGQSGFLLGLSRRPVRREKLQNEAICIRGMTNDTAKSKVKVAGEAAAAGPLLPTQPPPIGGTGGRPGRCP